MACRKRVLKLPIVNSCASQNSLSTTKPNTAQDFAPRASCQIRKIKGSACAGNAGDVFPAIDFKAND